MSDTTDDYDIHIVGPKGADAKILHYADKYSGYWQDRRDWYWFCRLLQEVFEALGVMLGVHNDSLDHEIRQIGSICHNWVIKRWPDVEVQYKPIEAPLFKHQDALSDEFVRQYHEEWLRKNDLHPPIHDRDE